MNIIGKEDTQFYGDQNREELRWIGKPWRRLLLITKRYYYQGRETSRSRDLSLHIGLRKFGLGFTVSVVKTDVLDYGDETQ